MGNRSQEGRGSVKKLAVLQHVDDWAMLERGVLYQGVTGNWRGSHKNHVERQKLIRRGVEYWKEIISRRGRSKGSK